MNRVKKYYKKTINFPFKLKDKITNKTLSRFRSYALDKFIKSEYLRNTTNIIPLSLLTTLIRIIINFLIISRIKTGVYLIDFSVSIITTIILSLLTPLFYDTISYLWQNDVLFFTNIVIDSLWGIDGPQFYELWKSRILGTIAVSTVTLLFFVEVNSYMIQEFIVHLSITGYITDKLNIYILKLIEKKELNNCLESKNIRTSPLQAKFILPSQIEIMESYNPNNKEYIFIEDYMTLENGVVTNHSSEDK